MQKHESEEQSGPEQRHDKDNLVGLKPHDSLTVRGTAVFRCVLGFEGGRGPADNGGCGLCLLSAMQGSQAPL